MQLAQAMTGPAFHPFPRLHRAAPARAVAPEVDPLAVAESRLRNPWIGDELGRHGRSCKVLDVGCGAGQLSNHLAERGHRVTGFDASIDNLSVAGWRDRTRSVAYHHGDSYRLPYADGSFDAVCALDFLDVEDPTRVLSEASRVLTKGGTFFFRTFNRTWFSSLMVKWFAKSSPKDGKTFRRPDEVTAMCDSNRLEMQKLRGMQFDRALFGLLTDGVSDDTRFTFSQSTRLAYAGMAVKK